MLNVYIKNNFITQLNSKPFLIEYSIPYCKSTILHSQHFRFHKCDQNYQRHWQEMGNSDSGKPILSHLNVMNIKVSFSARAYGSSFSISFILIIDSFPVWS